jgi:two-component system, cell cycle sensor histidine kinase and response regulator CckA
VMEGNETILLVEDDDGVRDLVRRILLHRGYAVLVAADAAAAMQVARDFNGCIHLLITDVIMPHISGDVLARSLAELRPEIKILFMSGYADDHMDNRDLESHDAGFLAKPFSAANLARKVRDILDGSGVARSELHAMDALTHI